MGGQEEEENAADVTEVEEGESFSFLKGHQDAKNPGKLIIGNQRYLSVSAVSLVKTFPYWYTCEIIKLGRKSVENNYISNLFPILDCATLNASSDDLPERMHNHTGCICVWLFSTVGFQMSPQIVCPR